MRFLAAAIATCLFHLAGPAANAQQIATPVNGDTRLVTFDFDPDVTYLILTRPKSVTDVMLAPGEQVLSLVAGDTVNFVFQVSASREHIFIKPKFEGLTTSASLVTNKTTYQLILRSANETGKWHQRVTWNNPEMVLQDVAASSRGAPQREIAAQSEQPVRVAGGGESALAIDKLQFNYLITGTDAIKPSQVFDDGIRTYFRIPEGMQEMPALFTLKDSEASLVNYAVKDGYLIAQGVGGIFLLKLGKQEVRVEKEGRRNFFGGLINGR
ncbi:TrbG/VirB9 family P-type conjugative transfer protein [Polaromonas sp. JS666]|uniref:TrbG/VirB9 family P-type conjugative transfer protein n=1 Tax=Polaromonas sp. (strain JS666 / ATCC BAA-500) TaxID=296591 RepID=UPI00005350F7|nr:TrbG/VirB9 family P-type conjugative transfer protein [Polaromonas sp. JS666]ABE47310.1 Conjugal transfer protein TrbG/VirB9/CagX [Polaromonas sp. JS666]